MEAQTGGSGPWLTVVGSTMIDQIAYAARMPERGETVIGDRFVQGFGGKGANQAVMARLLGAQVAMVNCVGDDGYGDETIANFARYGIDTTYVRRFPGSSGVAPIWVEADGSNRIIIIPGANDGLLPEHAAAAVAAPRSASTRSSPSSRSTRRSPRPPSAPPASAARRPS